MVRAKIWKASKDALAGFMITNDVAIMAGNTSNFIAVGKAGVSVSGKSISFNVPSENERHGGLFVRMPDFTQMIPSNIITNVPQQIPAPPLGMLIQLTQDLPFFFAMLA